MKDCTLFFEGLCTLLLLRDVCSSNNENYASLSNYLLTVNGEEFLLS